MVKFVAYSYVVKTLAEAIIIQKRSRLKLHREMFESQLYMCNFKTDGCCLASKLVHMYALKLNETPLYNNTAKILSPCLMNNLQFQSSTAAHIHMKLQSYYVSKV